MHRHLKEYLSQKENQVITIKKNKKNRPRQESNLESLESSDELEDRNLAP